MQDQSETKNSDEETPKICDFCQEASTQLDVFNDCYHRICSLCLYRRIFCANLEELQNSDSAEINCKCSVGYMFKNLDEIETIIKQKNEIDEKRRNEKNQIKTIPRCNMHPAVFLDHYCVECCTVICKECSNNNENPHFEHRMIKCSKIKKTLTNEINALKELLGISNFDLFQVAFNEIATNVKNSAEKHFSKVVDQIEELINYLIEFKKEYETNYKRELFRIVKTLKLYKLFYENFYGDINECLSSDDINFMRYINNINGILSAGSIENDDEVCRTLNTLRDNVDRIKSKLKTPIKAKFDFVPLSRQFQCDNYFETGHKEHIKTMIQTKNERIITCSNFNIRVWTENSETTSEYDCISNINKNVGRIKTLFELKDGRLITVHEVNKEQEEEHNKLTVWKETKQGYVIEQTISEHNKEINGVSQLKDGRLISCCNDGKIIIWKETNTNQNKEDDNDEETQGHKIFSVAQQFSENDSPLNIIISLFDNRIATSGNDNRLRIWANDGENHFRCQYNFDANNDTFTSMLQLTSGDLIVTIRNSKSLLWWKAKKDYFIVSQRISGHGGEVTAVTECRDKRIATSCVDKMVRLFRYVEGDQPEYVLDFTVEAYVHGIYNLKQLKDGKLWATGTDKRLVSWRSRNDMY